MRPAAESSKPAATSPGDASRTAGLVVALGYNVVMLVKYSRRMGSSL